MAFFKKRWFLAIFIVVVLGLIAIGWLALPEYSHSATLHVNCEKLGLGLTGDEVAKYFESCGVQNLGGAGRPRTTNEIQTWGHRGGRYFSITAICSVQYDSDGRVAATEFQKMTSVSLGGYVLYQSVDAKPLKGTIDSRVFEWRSPEVSQ
jgi:DNA-binding transcriptional regulator of glucitol operon